MFRLLRPLVFLLVSPVAMAQEAATSLAPVRVFGSDRATLSEPMTPGQVSSGVIESQQITDVNRALRQTPGIYVREEDGQGLRPNIGLRGTNPDRSKKVTLLEDDILIGPAPYSAPAAYYTPSMNHVESLNIYKGFAATGIGPNSIGGAVDYITTMIPSKLSTELESTYGSFSTWNNILTHGGPTSFGSYLIQGSYWESDGFKDLDGGGYTGFNKTDIYTKLRVDLPGSEERLHALEFRFGYAHEDSHETYLGLTRADFEDSPYRRYRASELDEMKWNHRQFQLRHELQLSADALLESTLYHHEFHRVWYRLDRFRDTSATLKDILLNPDTGTNAIKYGILTGELDSSALGGTNGELYIARNERKYFSQGIQSRFSTSLSTGAIEIKPWVFARFHKDEIKRNHTRDGYEMISGQMVRTTEPTGTDALNSESADAITGALGGDIEIRDLVITPVMRYESVGYEFRNRLNSSVNNDRRSEVFIPGLSFLYQFSDSFSSRVSWNKAATIAGLSADGSEVKEEADNYELELKFIDPQHFVEGQVTFFYMDYKNLTGTCTASNGCASSHIGTAFDGGRATVKGVELAAAKGFDLGSVFIPIHGNVTLLQAEFDSSFNSTSSEWGMGWVSPGDPLPYVPEVQYSLTFGLEWKKFRQDLIFFYQSKVYDQSVADNRTEIDGFGVVDWAANYEFSSSLDLMIKVDNLLNRKYAVAARPFGFRPGKPQAFQVGFRYEF